MAHDDEAVLVVNQEYADEDYLHTGARQGYDGVDEQRTPTPAWCTAP
jgi:hypothetical protein